MFRGRSLLRPTIAVLALMSAAGAGGGDGAKQRSLPCGICLVEVAVDGRGQRLLRRNPPSISDISPNGERLLYTKSRLGVFTSRLDGSGERRLVGDAGVSEASFSPDGRQVAYVRAGNSPGREAPCGGLEIRLVGSDGSDDRRFQACASRPLWSPDGRSLLFASSQSAESGRWWLAQVDRGGRHSVGLWEARDGYLPRSPRWSPRGDALAYQTYARPRQPSGHGTFIGGPMRAAATEIQVVRTDGTPISAIADATGPSWSPQGTRLAFNRVVPLASYYGDSASSLWLADASGRRAHRVRRDYALPVEWSPDGRLLVSVAEGDILVMRPDGTALRRVTNNPSGGQITGLWWLRDSSRLRFLWECTQEFQPCGS